jgi:hypothetical protein
MTDQMLVVASCSGRKAKLQSLPSSATQMDSLPPRGPQRQIKKEEEDRHEIAH